MISININTGLKQPNSKNSRQFPQVQFFVAFLVIKFHMDFNSYLYNLFKKMGEGIKVSNNNVLRLLHEI